MLPGHHGHRLLPICCPDHWVVYDSSTAHVAEVDPQGLISAEDVAQATTKSFQNYDLSRPAALEPGGQLDRQDSR
jgi:hypothetical protein